MKTKTTTNKNQTKPKNPSSLCMLTQLNNYCEPEWGNHGVSKEARNHQDRMLSHSPGPVPSGSTQLPQNLLQGSFSPVKSSANHAFPLKEKEREKERNKKASPRILTVINRVHRLTDLGFLGPWWGLGTALGGQSSYFSFLHPPLGATTLPQPRNFKQGHCLEIPFLCVHLKDVLKLNLCWRRNFHPVQFPPAWACWGVAVAVWMCFGGYVGGILPVPYICKIKI